MPFDGMQYLRDKYNQAKAYVAADPELSTYAAVAKTGGQALEGVASAGAKAFQLSSPLAWAAANAGNPNASTDMLGQIAHIPGGQAAVNPDLLTAGGSRIYESLKQLAEKHDWAAKAVEHIENNITPGRSSMILNDKWAAGSPTMNGATNEVPGIFRKQINQIRENVPNTPLQDVTLSSVKGGPSAEEVAKDAAMKERMAAEEVADQRAAEERYKKFNEDTVKQNKKWANEPSFRRIHSNNEITAIPGGGEGGQSPEMDLNVVKDATTNSVFDKDGNIIDPNDAAANTIRAMKQTDEQNYLDEARHFLNKTHTPEEADAAIESHSMMEWNNPALDRLSNSYAVRPQGVLQELRNQNDGALPSEIQPTKPSEGDTE
jgi:hypothetical protein